MKLLQLKIIIDAYSEKLPNDTIIKLVCIDDKEDISIHAEANLIRFDLVDQEINIVAYKNMHAFREEYIYFHERLQEADPSTPVNYSAYELDDNDLPINNLDQIAVEGRVKIVQEVADNKYGMTSEQIYTYDDGSLYESEILENPTYLQLAVEYRKQIETNKDYNHIYFEGFAILRKENDIIYIQLKGGS